MARPRRTGAQILEIVKGLTPYDRFRYYINERIEIRNRRLQGLPREQWTRDPILAQYKFTNARRAWDFTSQWLIKNWYKPHSQEQSSGIAAAFARFFCYVPTLQLVGYPSRHVSLWLSNANKTLTHAANRGEKVFTSAYIIGGVRAGEKKVDWVIRKYLTPVHETTLLRGPWMGAIDELHEELRQFPGWGDFMTQEVMLDLMYTQVLCDKRVDDKRMYGFAGPGAMRGLKWINGFRPENREHAQDLMLQLWSKARDDKQLLPELRGTLTVHDIEFNLCEFDKYSRTLFGDGKPKQLFTPRDTGELTLL
jgi:hypothetical protein